tara:strand:+ start:237 stop:608 length:372 start_codon:yes stop_codon:yes gene_type:complete
MKICKHILGWFNLEMSVSLKVKNKKEEREHDYSKVGSYLVTKRFHDGSLNFFEVGDTIEIGYEVIHNNYNQRKFNHFSIFYIPKSGDDLYMEIFNRGNQENYDSVIENSTKISNETTGFKNPK